MKHGQRLRLIMVMALLVMGAGGCGHGASWSALPRGPGPLGTASSSSPGSYTVAPMEETALQPPSAMSSMRSTRSDIQGFGWTQISGAATQVAASPDGSLWALSTQSPNGMDRYIWHRQGGSWTNISGAASRISVAPNGILWAINTAGGIYEYDGAGWHTVAGGASDITAAADGSVYAISISPGNSAGRAIWHYVNGAWTQIPGAAVHVVATWDPKSYATLGNEGGSGIYAANASSAIYYFDGRSWTSVPGVAVDLAPSGSGGVFGLTPPNANGYPIAYLNLDNGSWNTMTGAATSIATDGTTLYAVGASGAIYSTVVTQSTSVSPPVPPGATTAKAAIITASTGGAINLASGSALSVPAGGVSTDANYALSELPSLPIGPGDPNLSASNAVMVTTSRTMPSGVRRKGVGTRSVRSVAGYVYLTLKSQDGDLPDSEPIVCVTDFHGVTDWYDFPNQQNVAAGTVTVQIPSDVFDAAKSISISTVHSTLGPAPADGGRMLAGPGWVSGATPDPTKRTLLFVHGVLSRVEDAFPASVAAAILSQSGYEQAIGYDYDWWQPPSVVAPLLAQYVNSLGLQKSISVEAHSYGTIVSMAAIPSFNVQVDNFIALGGPLGGTPLLNPTSIQSFLFGVTGALRAPSSMPDRINELHDASTTGLSDVLASNSATLASIRASLITNPWQGPHRVIKVAGGIALPSWDSLDDLYYKAEDPAYNASLPFDGLVAVDSATLCSVVGAAPSDSNYNGPAALTAAQQFPYNHTQLEAAPAIQAWTTSNVAFADGWNALSMTFKGDAHWNAWWVTGRPGHVGTVTLSSSNPALVTVSPSTISTIPTQVAPGVLPPVNAYTTITSHASTAGGSVQIAPYVTYDDGQQNHYFSSIDVTVLQGASNPQNC